MPIDSSEEKKIIQACLEGKPNSWEKFVTQYQLLIYNIIHRTLSRHSNSVDLTLVGDIFQTFFLSLLQNDYAKLRRFKWKNGKSFSSWLIVVTRNFVVDYLRKKGRRTNCLHAANFNDGEHQGSPEGKILQEEVATPIEILKKQEDLQALKKAIEQLSLKDKQLLELLFFQELPPDKVAKLLNKSTDAIYTQKKRVLERLQKNYIIN
jgi:RNA polymerase sigma factor (sigma-70 family)